MQRSSAATAAAYAANHVQGCSDFGGSSSSADSRAGARTVAQSGGRTAARVRAQGSGCFPRTMMTAAQAASATRRNLRRGSGYPASSRQPRERRGGWRFAAQHTGSQQPVQRLPSITATGQRHA
ncbi:hypothetical protein Dimus_033044 [Dionaea muscipula]